MVLWQCVADTRRALWMSARSFGFGFGEHLVNYCFPFPKEDGDYPTQRTSAKVPRFAFFSLGATEKHGETPSTGLWV